MNECNNDKEREGMMNTMIGGLTTGWGGNPQLLRPTGETRMQVARMYNTTCIYYMYILGYLDMEFRMLKEYAINLGIFRQDVKKDINIIATEPPGAGRMRRDGRGGKDGRIKKYKLHTLDRGNDGGDVNLTLPLTPPRGGECIAKK